METWYQIKKNWLERGIKPVNVDRSTEKSIWLEGLSGRIAIETGWDVHLKTRDDAERAFLDLVDMEIDSSKRKIEYEGANISKLQDLKEKLKRGEI